MVFFLVFDWKVVKSGKMTNRESDHPEQGVVENPLSPSQQDALWKVGMVQLVKERENELSDEQLLKGVLFRAISGAASNLAYYDPKERRGELVFRHYRVPTEHLIFPELETYFSANERDGAEAVLSIEFHKSRKEKGCIIRRKRVYTPERRELSIYFGIPEKVCAFSIEDIRRIKRKELDFFPPIPMDKWRSISLDKWRSRRTFETGDLEIADLHSFWKSLESALKKDDPQYLLKLEERVLYV